MFPEVLKNNKSVYLDYAATTPLDSLVKKAMEPYLGRMFGNPSSLYKKGKEAKLAVEQSRRNIGRLINSRPSEIVFTSGGSESVNLAIFGAARNYHNRERKKFHLITSSIEHHSVINSFKALEEEGYKTTLIGVDEEGFVNIAELKKAIRPETIFVSVMLANNEIGTIQKVGEIAHFVGRLNTERRQKKLPSIIVHTDACQAPGFLDLNVQRLGVDLMSVNGSKIYGPKQSGFLYVRNGVKLKPLIYGGGQEGGLRAGTENVPGIVGLARAFELAYENMEKESRRLSVLRDYLINRIKAEMRSALLNGPDVTKLKVKQYTSKKSGDILRLPNNINFCFKGIEGEALMLYLDAYGFSVSTASACSTGTADPSHVLLALGRSKVQAQSAIRFSLGKFTTKSDLDNLTKVLPGLVKELQKVSKLN